MKLLNKRTAQLAAGIALGNYLAERFILKAGPDDPQGMVLVAPGPGMDDVARVVASIAATYGIQKAMGAL